MRKLLISAALISLLIVAPASAQIISVTPTMTATWTPTWTETWTSTATSTWTSTATSSMTLTATPTATPTMTLTATSTATPTATQIVVTQWAWDKSVKQIQNEGFNDTTQRHKVEGGVSVTGQPVTAVTTGGDEIANETTLASLLAAAATEATIELIRLLLVSLDGKDYATETTLAAQSTAQATAALQTAANALLTTIAGLDYATETTLTAQSTAALQTAANALLTTVDATLTTIAGLDYATETTLAAQSAAQATAALQTAANGLLTTIAGLDFATETTLAAQSAAQATAALQTAANTLLTTIAGLDYATETTLAANTAGLSGTIVGTEQQVDVVAPLPAGANIIGEFKLTDGTHDVEVSSDGAAMVGGSDTAGSDSLSNNSMIKAYGADGAEGPWIVAPVVYNGATHDMMRGDTDGLDVSDCSAGTQTNDIKVTMDGESVALADASTNTIGARFVYNPNNVTATGAYSAQQTDTAVWTPAAGKKAVLMGVYITSNTVLTIQIEDNDVDVVPPSYVAAKGGAVITAGPAPLWIGDDNDTLDITSSGAGTFSVLLWGYEIE